MPSALLFPSFITETPNRCRHLCSFGVDKESRASQTGSVVDGMWPGEMRQDALTNHRKEHLIMTIPSLNGASTKTLLDGTLPVRPFHPDGFVGSLQADGQQVRVAALACDDERVIALSLVGFDTSIGVVLARLWSSTAVPFEPATTLQEEWSGPGQLKRSSERYKQCVAHLEGTREVHALALLRTAHLTEGILHPPDLPEMGEQSSATTVEQEQGTAPSSKQRKAAAMDTALRPGQLG